MEALLPHGDVLDAVEVSDALDSCNRGDAFGSRAADLLHRARGETPLPSGEKLVDDFPSR